ncbi:hypothetical protein HMPREF1633_10065 [Tissierellia bacterium S5-A11]|nr:hypothetical protein HMPREF1633_10065 [Tissierellia bacterium S5-A11]
MTVSNPYKKAVIIAKTYLPALGLGWELTQRGIPTEVTQEKVSQVEGTLTILEVDGYFTFSLNVTDKKLPLDAEKKEVIPFIDEILKKVPLEFDDLTDRERRLVRGILQGFTNKEIAGRLYLSEKTVRNNLTALYRKLKIQRREELVVRYNGNLKD